MECQFDPAFRLSRLFCLYPSIKYLCWIADAGMWGWSSRDENNKLRKEPGCSWIEVKDVVHTFLVGDKAHPRCKEIYKKNLDLACMLYTFTTTRRTWDFLRPWLKFWIIQEWIQKSWTQVQQHIQQDLEFYTLIDLWEDHTACDIAIGFVLYNLRVLRNLENTVPVFRKKQ